MHTLARTHARTMLNTTTTTTTTHTKCTVDAISRAPAANGRRQAKMKTSMIAKNVLLFDERYALGDYLKITFL